MYSLDQILFMKNCLYDIRVFRYKLMLQCWETNPEDRPSFHEIIDILQEHAENNKVG